jgi:hypothetical protein
MPRDRDYEDRSAKGRSGFGYFIMLIAGVAVGAVILYDWGSSGPKNRIAPQQSAPGSPSEPPPRPATGPGVIQ